MTWAEVPHLMVQLTKGGQPITIRNKNMIAQKDIAVTINASVGTTTYQNVIVVATNMEKLVGGVWVDYDASPVHILKNYFARNIGRIKTTGENTSGTIISNTVLRGASSFRKGSECITQSVFLHFYLATTIHALQGKTVANHRFFHKFCNFLQNKMKMKIIVLPLLLLTCIAPLSLFAQTEDLETKRVLQALDKDAAFQAFKTKLDAISQSANGRNTNVAEVKKLFSDNKPLFEKLQSTYKVKPVSLTSQASQFRKVDASANANANVANKQKGFFKKMAYFSKFERTVVPPFKQKFNFWHNIYGGTWQLREINTNEAAGKIGFTVNKSDAMYISSGTIGFQQDFTVPSDATILAAKVTIEYSTFFTGWDTYPSQFGVGLYVYTSPNFNSAFTSQLPDYRVMGTNWKDLGDIVPWTTVANLGDVGEYHAATDSSFTATGYVTPGSTLTFKIGMGYVERTGGTIAYYSQRGSNGTYHYGEFIVKKITVNYLRSGQ